MVTTRPVRLLRRAEVDLADIWKFVAQDNPAAADRVIGRITDQIERLSDFPDIGRQADHVRPGFRLIGADPYVVLFRVVDRSVEIVRVVHGARNLSRLRY